MMKRKPEMLSKKTFFALASSMVLAAAGSAQAMLTDGLEQSWDAAQAGGTAGVVANLVPGGPSIQLGSGASNDGTSINLSGTDSWSPFSSPVNVPDSAITIELWISGLASDDPDTGTWPVLIGNTTNKYRDLINSGAASNEDSFVFQRGRHADYQVYFYYADAEVCCSAGGRDFMSHMGGTYDGELHQLVAILGEDGTGEITDFRTYIDGTLITSAITGQFSSGDRLHAGTGYTMDHVTDLMGIGGGWDHAQGIVKDAQSSGSIHALNIWNRALSAAEVTESLNDGANGYVVPEPASLALLTLGGLTVLRRRR